MQDAPPDPVIAAFGASGTPRRLPGGRNTSFRVGDVVLKPVENLEEARWVAGVFASLRDDEAFRVPRPIGAPQAGAVEDRGVEDWVVDGWVAWQFVSGDTVSGERFAERLAVSRAFHAALSGLDRPTFLDARDDPWSVADRIVWEGAPWHPHPRVAPVAERLEALLGPLALPAQVVHGDLTGNVMFARGRPPAVIDFVPYWRPAAYADAIVTVDAVTWEGAPTTLARRVAAGPPRRQLMARAALWRLLVSDVFHRTRRLPDAYLDGVRRYERLVSWLEGDAAEASRA